MLVGNEVDNYVKLSQPHWLNYEFICIYVGDIRIPHHRFHIGIGDNIDCEMPNLLVISFRVAIRPASIHSMHSLPLLGHAQLPAAQFVWWGHQPQNPMEGALHSQKRRGWSRWSQLSHTAPKRGEPKTGSCTSSPSGFQASENLAMEPKEAETRNSMAHAGIKNQACWRFWLRRFCMVLWPILTHSRETQASVTMIVYEYVQIAKTDKTSSPYVTSKIGFPKCFPSNFIQLQRRLQKLPPHLCARWLHQQSALLSHHALDRRMSDIRRMSENVGECRRSENVGECRHQSPGHLFRSCWVSGDWKITPNAGPRLGSTLWAAYVLILWSFQIFQGHIYTYERWLYMFDSIMCSVNFKLHVNKW